MVSLSKLFFVFCKVGLLMFGGGAAMLPILKAEMVDRRRYATADELLDLYSLSQCTPGIIAVNVATFIGHKLRGAWGAAVATLGVITPAVLIITAIAAVLSNFMDNRYVIYAFSGIRLAVVALIINVVIELAQSNLRNRQKMITFMIALALLLLIKISPALLVIIMGSGAAIWGELARRMKKK